MFLRDFASEQPWPPLGIVLDACLGVLDSVADIRTALKDGVTSGCAWRLLTIFRAMPAFLRDPVYTWVVGNRYSLFEKNTHCWAALPAYRDRIL